MTTPKKITCDYPMRSTWPKFYTIDDSLDDIAGRAMRTTTFADLHYNEYRISEHGYISGFDEDIKFPQLLTGFSGDVIFYLESNQSYFNFIAKVKAGRVLGIFHFPVRTTWKVDVSKIPDKVGLFDRSDDGSFIADSYQ